MRRLIYFMAGLGILGACHNADTPKKLPYLGNRQTVTKTVNGKPEVDTIYASIPPFSYTNQYGKTITDKDVNGKIYVADFFFTSCPSICPVMQRNMLTVYNEFKSDPNVKILSYTIDPKHDTVPVLKQYADKLGITGNSWWLLYGKKEEIYQIAKSYLTGVNDALVHDGWFILIDKQKHPRGMYDGTDQKQVAQLVVDMHMLEKE
jgi:protein SCO1